MDPVTAVGLVSNIIQLVCVARNVVITFNELRKSTDGLSEEANRFLQSADTVLQGLDRVASCSNETEAKDSFQEHALEMQVLINIYKSKLEELRVKDPKTSYRTFKAALKGWWRKEQLEASFKAIDQMSAQITTHIITIYVPSMSLKLGNIYQQNSEMELNCHIRWICSWNKLSRPTPGQLCMVRAWSVGCRSGSLIESCSRAIDNASERYIFHNYSIERIESLKLTTRRLNGYLTATITTLRHPNTQDSENGYQKTRRQITCFGSLENLVLAKAP
jgi:hypothetical protein